MSVLLLWEFLAFVLIVVAALLVVWRPGIAPFDSEAANGPATTVVVVAGGLVVRGMVGRSGRIIRSVIRSDRPLLLSLALSVTAGLLALVSMAARTRPPALWA